MNFDLSGKTVVLVGGAGILGKKMALALLEHKASVAIVDHSDQLPDIVKALSKEAGSELIKGYQCSIVSREQLIETKDAILKDFGNISVLINNAAIKTDNFFEPFESFPEDDWDIIMGVNVKGVMLCCQVFGGVLAKNNGGSIINTLSIYGIVAPDQRIYKGSQYEGREINTPAVYSSSKAAVWGLTKYLASYWGEKNIRVNAITPGGVFSGQNDTFVNNYSARVPLGRMANQDEMSGAIIFLASNASSYITGQNIIVDGGLTVW